MSFEQIRDCLSAAVEAGAFPGAAFAVGGPDNFSCGWIGRQRYDQESLPIDESTVWDLASLTKVMATAPVLMRLVESGQVDLDAPARVYVREVRHSFTIRDLLTHRSGMAAYYDFWRDCKTPAEAEARLLSLELDYVTGSQTLYSCLGFLILKLVAEQVTGQPFEELVEEFLVTPLELASAGFNPPPAVRANISPTERRPFWRAGDGEFLHGEVHDPAAFLFGGVSGNAGLFANVLDVAEYAQTWLCPDTFWSAEIIRQFSESSDERALGWAKWTPGCSGGSGCSPKAIGHTGFTGTSIWIDQDRQKFGVLLTNRVHPTSESQKIAEIRKQFYDLVWAS